MKKKIWTGVKKKWAGHEYMSWRWTGDEQELNRKYSTGDEHEINNI